ncbi:NfeD family protein [Rickettsia endosymbiont of Cardiosporidium cionae]|uniref:NfeD family protein n=1 Tax=Rickettsia endosymbiont of Cardiosporidium cionae TaxID=2777155 RepID=UPI001894186E|nr:NfeD family protein [Rickettsia endosymbiont of Cardiosporidium cionae]KAF8818460.1 NfeD family protein [Rickettsia endosymbiont of Cardiosporidium cionae]
MLELSMSPKIWLIIGVIFIILEFFVIQSVGLLFLGFGSLSIAIISEYFSICYIYQIVIFSILSLVWLIILLPIIVKQTRKTKYDDMIGKEVLVYGNPIKCGILGEVQWSGVVMNAKLIDPDCIAIPGDKLFILRVEGNILICSRFNKMNINTE